MGARNPVSTCRKLPYCLPKHCWLLWGRLLTCGGLKTRHLRRAYKATPIGAQDAILPHRPQLVYANYCNLALVSAAVLALLAGAAGFGQTRTGIAPQPPPGGAVQKIAATRPRKSDAEIEKAIRAKLAKSKIKADRFNVHVQGGVATFEGTTNVIQHKGVATRFAKSAGATRVANNIQIRQAVHGNVTAGLPQGLRRAEIKRGDAPSGGTSSGKPAVGSTAASAQIRQATPDKPNPAQGLKRAQIKRPDGASSSQPAVGSTGSTGSTATAQNR